MGETLTLTQEMREQIEVTRAWRNRANEAIQERDEARAERDCIIRRAISLGYCPHERGIQCEDETKDCYSCVLEWAAAQKGGGE